MTFRQVKSIGAAMLAVASLSPRFRTELGARLIRATLLVDTMDERFGFFFTRLRIAVVLGFASDDMLDRYRQLGYRSTDRYRPDKPTFHHALFPWEQSVIEKMFPASPARVLIGGAGGGREPFAMAKMGYDIVAFEPVPELARAMAKHIPVNARIRAYLASYGDLPCLHSVHSGEPQARLDQEAPFDAGILGWGSFSHLKTDSERVLALERMANLVNGPILVSLFFRPGDHDGQSSKLRWLRHRLPGRNKIPGNTFSIKIGPYKELTEHEFGELVARAGMSIDFLEIGEWHTASTHAVISSLAKKADRSPAN